MLCTAPLRALQLSERCWLQLPGSSNLTRACKPLNLHGECYLVGFAYDATLHNVQILECTIVDHVLCNFR